MTITSAYPRFHIPKTDLFSFIFEPNLNHVATNKVIYEDADDPRRYYTRSDVYKSSVEFGRGLVVLYGLKKGDRVLIVSQNDVDMPIAIYGVLWAGGIVSTANPTYTASELAQQISDSGATILIAHSAALNAAKEACSRLGRPGTKIVTIGAVSNDIRQTHWATVRICGAANLSLRRPTIDADEDLAFLVYSSGTTGKPKGVMLSHYNIIANIMQLTACSAGNLGSSGDKQCHIPGIPDAPPTGDKMLSTLPFFHIYGLTALVLAPLTNGIHTIILARFDIRHFCHLIQQHRITFIYIVPPIALELAKNPCVTRYDLSSIRMTNSGAAPLSRELQHAVYKRTGIRVKQGYGLSETSPTTHEQRWQDWDRKSGSIGRLFSNMQAKFCEVQDEQGLVGGGDLQELPAGQVGELYVKGPNVFKGYWNNPEATASCLSKDGWFRTGDIGYMDIDGDFYITDRAKELIKYKGFQVAPAELEGYLLEHPLIDDAAVVGVISQIQGTEVPRAYIVRHGGMKAVKPSDEKEILNWLSEKVVRYKRLHGGISFVESIPKSKSGKILRRTLKDQARKEFMALEALAGGRSRL